MGDVKWDRKDPKKEIVEFIEEHKGELLLDFTTVVKLVGFFEDENDYYYECISLNKGVYYKSCVGAFYTLKGVLPDKEYDYLVHFFGLNVDFALQAQRNRGEIP